MNSATRLRRVSPSSAVIHAFIISRGNSWIFGMDGGLGRTSSKKKWRNSNANSIGAFVHHIIVSSLKKIHPRHPPREFPLGLRAPVLGADFAERLKYQEMSRSSKSPQLVGERILLSPVRCLGSCSFHSHPAEPDRAHPTRPHKPLSGFSIHV